MDEIMTHFRPRIEPQPLFTDHELAALTMPILLLAGEDDALLPSKKTVTRLCRHRAQCDCPTSASDGTCIAHTHFRDRTVPDRNGLRLSRMTCPRHKHPAMPDTTKAPEDLRSPSGLSYYRPSLGSPVCGEAGSNRQHRALAARCHHRRVPLQPAGQLPPHRLPLGPAPRQLLRPTHRPPAAAPGCPA